MDKHDGTAMLLSELSQRTDHCSHFVLAVHIRPTPKVNSKWVHNDESRSQIDQTSFELANPRFIEAE